MIGRVALLLIPALVLAQEPSDSVTVTATRVERPLLEVPAALDRVHADELRFARPQVNLSESISRVPGIIVQNRQNYAQDLQVSSRGFGARASFGIRGIRLLADGIPASMPDGQGQASTFDLGSAERIEVLRGPFSVLHGNASGGVINVMTERGAREPGIAPSLALGSYGTTRAALKAGGLADSVDWRVNASRFRTDGYRQHSAARRAQLNAKLTFGLGETTSLALVANGLDSPDTQDPLGLTRMQAETDPRQAVANAFTFDTRKSVRQQQAGATLTHRVGDTSVEGTLYAGHRDVRQFLAFAGAAPATTSGGVIDLDRDYGGAALRVSRRDTWLGKPLTLSLGGEHERMDERRKGFVNLNGQPGELRRDEDDVVTATGLYAQGEWRFAERWILLAGVRTNRVAFRSSDFYIAPGNPDDSGAKTYRRTTPVAGLTWRLAPATSLYVNAGRGFETPTFTELAYQNSGTGLNFALAASRSRHVEAGLKTVFAGGARLNVALFEIATRDEIVVDASSGGRTTFKNAGRTQRTGLEASAEGTLGAGFEALAALTLLDATFRDAFTSGATTVLAGNRLPGVPRGNLYAELRWRHAPSGFTAALEAQHRTRVAVNDLNTEFADAYTVTNLALGFEQRGRAWRVVEFLRIDNLADRRTIGSVIVNETNGRFYEPAPGRGYLVGVQARYALD